MIDHATALNAAHPKPDAGYASWQSAMGKAVMHRDPEARTAGPIPTFASLVRGNALAAQAYAPGSGAITDGTPDIAYTSPENESEYSFADVIDIINPLQHLPVIGTIYRKLTGDTIKPMSNIIGGALFGGPVGAVASTANVVIKSATGKDVTENAFALAGYDATPQPRKPVLAYEKAASLSTQNHMASANLIEAAPNENGVYITADGRRNFSARGTVTQGWNV